MFLGNNFRGTNLTIPIHRGIISREDENKSKKSRKTWLLPVILLAAGLLVIVYFTPRNTEQTPYTSETEVQAEVFSENENVDE